MTVRYIEMTLNQAVMSTDVLQIPLEYNIGLEIISNKILKVSL